MHQEMIQISREVLAVSKKSLASIQGVTRATKILAINATIEAAHAGSAGRGFAIVAAEVGKISEEINKITETLGSVLEKQLSALDRMSAELVVNARGKRLADLSLNMIEIIDRNLYERSCDVRWWATDAAVVTCAADPSPQFRDHTASRLGVILDSYTVYLDIWVTDMQGKVLANGRPKQFPQTVGLNVAPQGWFQKALATGDGTEFAVDDIRHDPTLGRLVATYAAAVREGGATQGKPIGVLGIFFDWEAQSRLVVEKVRLSEEEKKCTRSLLIDSQQRIIAASDGQGILSATFPLRSSVERSGYYQDAQGNLVGFALTPGYETYKGLGWYGVIAQGAEAG